ncbi:hypothetical protein [Mycobacterium sp. 050134]|uniref:hypothetical protein n=1 Tax=Mycobacterium sp. 050134 TaxID=3096111 RepID=UPI002EDAD6BF
MTHLLLAVLADNAPRNTGPDFGKASPVGLLIVVLLLIATLLLLRSMNRQLKKVPDSFDPKHPEPDQAADEGTDTVEQPPDRPDGAARGPGPGDEPG